MVLGLVFLTAALGFYARNRAEDERAGAASARALSLVEEVITDTAIRPAPEAEREMPEIKIDGQWYIGKLAIPRLELELPVLSEWNDERLKIAPCRFRGTAAGEDLVLVAHNYRRHFGPIRRLEPGDRVLFTDMKGQVFAYQVTDAAVVDPTALEQVTAGVHDLILITCTYGGQSRLMVCCDRIQCTGVSEKACGLCFVFLTEKCVGCITGRSFDLPVFAFMASP